MMKAGKGPLIVENECYYSKANPMNDNSYDEQMHVGNYKCVSV